MNGSIKLVMKNNYYELEHNPKYEKFRRLATSLPSLGNKYYNLHTKNLVPTNIKINVDLFKKELKNYEHKFEQWGITHTDLPRYSLALTETELTYPDVYPNPANWPLDVWCINYPDYPFFDTSFTKINETFKEMKSLKKLMIFKNHFARCNILKWDRSARFFPHYDVRYPFHNLRLWGTTDPDNYGFCFLDKEKNEYIREENIEAGRIYLASTEKWHHAYSTADNNFTFFISLQISAYDILKNMIK